MNENKVRIDLDEKYENNLRKLHCMEQTTLFSFVSIYREHRCEFIFCV